MTATYSARYRDCLGEERTTILSDGETLTMVVRGVHFQGNDFDRFEAKNLSDPTLLSSFEFLHGNLCFCMIEADFPVPAVMPAGIVEGLLTCELRLKGQLPVTNQMDPTRLTLRLVANRQVYASMGKTGWFEGEMRDVQSQLPTGTLMKTCFNCAYSDYSPYGHGLFGNMICFRANKAGYLAMPSGEDFDKDTYFDVLDTVSEMVQEIYLCPEFEKRLPGQGYRG